MDNFNDIVLILPILVPLILATICLFSWKNVRIQNWINILGSFLILAVSGLLMKQVWTQGIISTQIAAWDAPFGITLVSDHLSATMVLLTGITSFAISLYTLNDTDLDNSRKSFGYFPLYNILIAGVCGSFLTGDMFNLFVWYEVILISAFVLLALGGEKQQIEGTIKYVSLNLISSIFFLSGVGILYGYAGSLNMADLAVIFSTVESPGLIIALSTLFLISFGIKAAVFPLFFWLPASYHTPPPVAVSAFFGALLTKVGVYAIIRVFTLIFVQDIPYTHNLILVIAGLTMLTGVLGTVAQSEFRRILSFHVVSQIGYLIMGLGLYTIAGLAGSIFYTIHVIIVKANLFLISGIVFRLRGSFDLKQLGGVYTAYPVLSLLFLISALSLAGIPPLSGFWAKLSLVQSGLESDEMLIVFVALLTGLLTLYSMTKIWNYAFWKESDAKVLYTSVPDVRSVNMLLVPVYILTGVVLILSFIAEPVFSLSTIAAEELMNPEMYIEAVLGGDK